uniref:Candidate secreted effector n=1 Tax=Meloidogyne incognita TaxID=6306 RepID=A0A914L2W2_MELIC
MMLAKLFNYFLYFNKRRILCIILFCIENYANGQLAIVPNLCTHPGRYFATAPARQLLPVAAPPMPAFKQPAPFGCAPVIQPAVPVQLAAPVIQPSPVVPRPLLPSPLFSPPPSFVPAATYLSPGIAAAAPIPSLPPRALATPLLPMASTLCLPAQALLQPPLPVPSGIAAATPPIFRAAPIAQPIPCFPVPCKNKRARSRNLKSLLTKQF